MQHPGTVTAVKPDSVTVQIESVSACASCQAHSKCGFAESKNKTVEIPTSDWKDYNPGDPVTVFITEDHGLLAVLLAYVLPAVVLLAVTIGLALAGLPDWLVILASFAALALYVLILYRSRQKLDRKFILTVSKC